AIRRLSLGRLELGHRSLAMRLDSSASLLTWDDLITIEGEVRTYAGMHRIVSRVIWMPGEPWPLLRLDASMSRMAVNYYKVDHAWVDLGRADAAILLAEVWPRRRD